MARRLSIILEDGLEIEKLKAAEIAANKEGESAVLYDNLMSQKNAEATKQELKEQGAEEDEPSEDDPAESSQASSPDEIQTAQEAYRQLSYVQEDFRDTWQSIKSSKMMEMAQFISTSLWTLGIIYGPKMASHLYKGVVYAFSKLVALLYHSSITLTKYIDRRVHSFENLKKEIDQLQQVIAELKKAKASKDLSNLRYSNEKVINHLKIHDSVDFSKNITILREFVNDTVADLDHHVSEDIGVVKHLVSGAMSQTVKTPEKLMGVKPFGSYMGTGVLNEYAAPSEYVKSYQSTKSLPGDVVMIAYLPADDISELGLVAKAYNDSSIFLGFDQEAFQQVSSVDYMTSEALGGFLNELTKLCDTCIAHQSFYEKVKRQQTSLKYSFKNYFMSLVSAVSKVSIKASLIEYVYLKSMFIDKVYLVAAMDVHDYNARVITHALSYVKDNVKKLT